MEVEIRFNSLVQRQCLFVDNGLLYSNTIDADDATLRLIAEAIEMRR